MLDLLPVGEALAGERLAPEQAPPPLLKVQPAGPDRQEDLLDLRVLGEPGRDRRALMAGQVIGDQVKRAGGVVGGDGVEECPIAKVLRARSGRVSTCPSQGRRAP